MSDATARQGALEDSLWDYLLHPDPEPFNAADNYLDGLRTAQRHNPHRGFTPGQHAEVFELSAARERRETRASESGLVVDTVLQAAYREIKGLRPHLERGKIRRAAQRIKRLDRVVNGKLKPHRIKSCMRRMSKAGPLRDGERVVELVRNGEGRVHYKGITRCGDPWCCPNCASIASEAARKDLREGVKIWRDDGNQTLLMTLTFSHTREDSLTPLWKGLQEARMTFARCPEMKKFREAVGWAGQVVTKEVTWGINAFHPHSHSIEFIGPYVTEEAIDYWCRILAVAWRHACVMNDLGEPSLERGFQMTVTDVDDYIAKWGIDAELTKWHIKRGRIKSGAKDEHRLNGYTPFDFLRVMGGDMDPVPAIGLTKKSAPVLFSEYAHAVKGSSPLRWSKGLKKTLEDLGANFDHGREAGSDDENKTEGALSVEQWIVVSRGNHQEEFKGLVEVQGWDFAQIFLDKWCAKSEQDRQRRTKRAVRHAGVAYLFRGSGS